MASNIESVYLYQLEEAEDYLRQAIITGDYTQLKVSHLKLALEALSRRVYQLENNIPDNLDKDEEDET